MQINIIYILGYQTRVTIPENRQRSSIKGPPRGLGSQCGESLHATLWSHSPNHNFLEDLICRDLAGSITTSILKMLTS